MIFSLECSLPIISRKEKEGKEEEIGKEEEKEEEEEEENWHETITIA